MTKLTYLIGDKEIISYNEARKEAERIGKQVVPKYTPIIEHEYASKERLEKLKKRYSKIK